MTNERPETHRRHKDNSLQKQGWFIDHGAESTTEALKQHAKRARDFGVGRK
jgi:hypothetical protein